MKKTINYEKDILFKTNIGEICSISLEHDFTVDDGYLRGDFIINGEYKIKEGVQNLKSITSTDSTAKDFVIAPNSIVRMRIYVWLEGQDVDMENNAAASKLTYNLELAMLN